jgi:hypothetical protein
VSGDLQREETFATAVIAVEERQAVEGETILPEPADGSGSGPDEMALVDGEGGGVWVADYGRTCGCLMG